QVAGPAHGGPLIRGPRPAQPLENEGPQSRAFAVVAAGRRDLLQPAMLQQRFHARLLAAELAIGLRKIARVADGEDLLAEHLPVLAGQPAVLAEPLEGVVVEHLCAKVGVVTRRIAAAPDVAEVVG